MNKFLFEDFGNLRALSSEVLKAVVSNSSSYGHLKDLGKDSKVLVTRESPDEIYNHYTNKNNSESAKFIVVRYGQDDLFLLTPNWDGLRVRSLSDFDYMLRQYSWSDQPQLQSTIKSASGFKTFISKAATFLLKYYTEKTTKILSKKEILSKINYQLIFADEERFKIKKDRRDRQNIENTVVKNGVSTPSVASMNKDSLKNRLKEFILNKLPQYNDTNDLPRTMEFLNPNTRFKLMGCPYKYSEYGSSRIDWSDLLKGGKAIVAFENEKPYDQNYDRFPRYIAFTIALRTDNYQLYIDNVYFDSSKNYSLKKDSLIDIDKFKNFVNGEEI